MNIDRELLKGSISLLLLSLLSRGEMYGYEIFQEASRRSANAFEFKEGTLLTAGNASITPSQPKAKRPLRNTRSNGCT